MKLKEFIANLNKMAEENPDILEFEVITSKDDEGNGFDKVIYDPSVGHFDPDDRDFTPIEDMEEYHEGSETELVICVN